jgi:molybdopterin/thiamine biosynthesis adenylyltransferase
MTQKANWYQDRNDRSLRYAGRVLPPDRPILVKLSAEYGTRYDGQVAVLVAANLLARMTPSVALCVPEVDIVAQLPWAGTPLRERLAEITYAADPSGSFEFRNTCDQDYVLYLGQERSPATVHGSGWNAYVGTSVSPLPESDHANPIGPALAVITAIARLFAIDMGAMDGPHLLNAFNWQNGIILDRGTPSFQAGVDLGSLWAVGVGSVGTAILYFLTLATRRFSASLFDMDFVKVQNLDRSPIFTNADVGSRLSKVEATEIYLRSVGVQDVVCENEPLDQSDIWFARQAGTPDLLISAANERDVRSVIERSAPPIQIYGTTGANWEASVLRHIPLVDACSCCLFPPEIPRAPTVCAADQLIQPGTGETIDAALPFLSFAAGLMAAAEILKTNLPGYPFSSNRTTLYTHPAVSPRFVSPPMRQREACSCISRSAAISRRMIEGSKYEFLSRRKPGGLPFSVAAPHSQADSMRP